MIRLWRIIRRSYNNWKRKSIELRLKWFRKTKWSKESRMWRATWGNFTIKCMEDSRKYSWILIKTFRTSWESLICSIKNRRMFFYKSANYKWCSNSRSIHEEEILLSDVLTRFRKLSTPHQNELSQVRKWWVWRLTIKRRWIN